MADLAEFSPKSRDGKSESAFRTISEVAAELDLPQHVLRFWESKFNQIKPLKRGGGRRYYRPDDIRLLRGIRDLLYNDGYTIKGVQKLLRQSGAKAIVDAESRPAAPMAPPETAIASQIDPAAAPADQDMRRELEGILRELLDLRAILRRA